MHNISSHCVSIQSWYSARRAKLQTCRHISHNNSVFKIITRHCAFIQYGFVAMARRPITRRKTNRNIHSSTYIMAPWRSSCRILRSPCSPSLQNVFLRQLNQLFVCKARSTLGSLQVLFCGKCAEKARRRDATPTPNPLWHSHVVGVYIVVIRGMSDEVYGGFVCGRHILRKWSMNTNISV